MLLSYRNDNERVTLEQQECETDTHTEKEKDICMKDYMNALVTVTVLNHLRVSVTTNDIQRPRE